MVKNYIKIALRNFQRHKIYSYLNIAGLAVGIACCMLILLFIQNELSYDSFNKKADRIYRINSDILLGSKEMHTPLTSDMMGYALKKDYPQVEEYTRVATFKGNKFIKKGNEFINETNIAHVDSTFFRVFTFPALSGNTETALNEPNTVVVTESIAKKYFGTTDVLGRIIHTKDDSGGDYKITAVIKDMPSNSHFNFDFLFSMSNMNYWWGSYISHNFHTYLLLRQGTDPKEFEKNFRQYTIKYVIPNAKEVMHISSIDEFEKAGNKLKYSLIPLRDIHLYSTRMYEFSPGGTIEYVYIFSAVALFILLIACINFMNLTTARSANRAREVGIRKVLGTLRKNLITQFLTESVIMAFIATALAIVLVNIFLPSFNSVSDKKLHFGNLFSTWLTPLLILLPLLLGLIAGSYPAFFLSSFNPVKVVKGKLREGSKSSGMRSALVIFQFTASIILITGTLVIYRQLSFIQNKNLGYQKDQVLVINDAWSLQNSLNPFKEEMLKVKGVESGTVTGYLPVPSNRNDNPVFKEASMDARSAFDMQTWVVDYDYIKTFGMEIIKGRDFSRDFPSDSSAVIINETTAKILGYKNPIGEKIYGVGDIRKGGTVSFTIIGVVKNFNFESLRQEIGPLSLNLGANWGSVSFKVASADIPAVLKEAENKWRLMASGMPFRYSFIDDSFSMLYAADQRIGSIAIVFSGLAIFVACLGLFGLATFLAEQRTKEIGIRKVLGANTGGIVMLLSKDFLKLVLIAFIAATPLAWYIMSIWLEDFAFRINMSWWMFAVSGVSVLIIAMVTVSYQAIKAAVANPVESLKYE